MYNINIFGSGIRYWICKIPMEIFGQFENFHLKYNESYENIFFDLALINKLGYSNWDNIYNIHSGRGFEIKGRNRIEIKHKTKNLKRFDSSELFYSPLMFEPYHVLHDETVLKSTKDFKLVVLIQVETGSFFKFRLDSTDFEINKLMFHLNYANIQSHFNEQFVTNLSYEGVVLEQKNEDVVCVGQRVIFL